MDVDLHVAARATGAAEPPLASSNPPVASFLATYDINLSS